MDMNTLHTFEVESMTAAALIYIVRLHGDQHWSCSCPHWQWRLAKELGHCKHIAAAITRQEARHDRC